MKPNISAGSSLHTCITVSNLLKQIYFLFVLFLKVDFRRLTTLNHLFRMLQPWNQLVLSGVIVFVSLHLRPVQCLLDTAHVSIHLERLFHFHLLIQHVLVPLLLSPLVVRQLRLKLPILLSLYPCLIHIEIIVIIELSQLCVFLLLYLQLLVIELLGLFFLSRNEVFLIVIPFLRFNNIPALFLLHI